MSLQDAISACGAILLPDDPGLLALRRAYAGKCMAAHAPQAAALQLLLAGDAKQAALALSTVGSVAALAAACEICLMRLDQLRRRFPHAEVSECTGAPLILWPWVSPEGTQWPVMHAEVSE